MLYSIPILERPLDVESIIEIVDSEFGTISDSNKEWSPDLP